MIARCVQNVINYLDGSSYDSDSIYEDIDIVCKYQIRQIPYEGQDKIYDLYNKMIMDRTKEVVNFYNALYSNYPSSILYNFYVYSNYPFKNSRDPKADRDLINKLHNFHFNNGTEEIISLTSLLLLNGGVNIDPSFDELIYNIVGNYGFPGGPLDIDNMRHAIYVGRISDTPYPTSIDGAKEYFNNSDTRESTGFYGEYIALDYIRDNLVDGDIVVWVSKNLGDGYGYDFLVYNHQKNRYIAYEVKATILQTEFDKDDLTYTEEATKINSLVPANNYEYHVIKILVNKELPIYKFSHDVSYMDDCYYDENGEWVRKVVQNNVINAPNPVNTIKRARRI